MQWAEYLEASQMAEKDNSSRPFSADGIYRANFDFCEDCTKAHCLAMSAKRLCNPRHLKQDNTKTAQRKVTA